MRNNNSNGGGVSAFLLGALIGGGIVFFLGTKKGKKLLKAITDEGMESISDLTDFIEEEEDLTTSGQDIAVEEEEREKEEKKPKTNGHTPQNESVVEQIKNAPRRFFRGVPKKAP